MSSMSKDATKTARDLLREKIERDCDAFVKAGGRIKIIPFGVSGGTWRRGILILNKRRKS